MITPQEIGIAIIESLKKSDRKTGKELFDTTLKYIAIEKEILDNEYFEIIDRASLFFTLDLINENAKNRKKFYFLHFELHGDKDGIELGNGDEIDWKEILPYFEKINILYKNSLSIYFAVCEGNSILRKINPFSRSPFAFIVGSFFEIGERETQYAFEQFYTCFFKEFKIIAALEEMKKASGKSDFTIISSNHIIDMLLEIEEKHNDKEQITTKLNELFPSDERDNPFTTYFINQLQNNIDINFTKIDKDYFLMEDLK